MYIRHTFALVTGANRGIGRALVRALLEVGAAKIYAAARQPDPLSETLALDRQKVVPVQLDVRDPDPVRALAAEIVESATRQQCQRPRFRFSARDADRSYPQF
jgi:NAD(P)-dependent dehydrogenase (short-subunit alcohol dehydrogenase family)